MPSQSAVVDFWPVGGSDPISLPMTIADIEAHVQADWMPWIPATMNSSFQGWPLALMEISEDPPRLAMKRQAAKCEKQWNSVLSWMMGIAGARQVIQREGYRWIAPVSAFLPGGVADLSRWDVGRFPRCSVRADSHPNNPSRLRPDYVVLRPISSSSPAGEPEWAVVEAKGTQRSIGQTRWQTSPNDWRCQARNLRLTVNEQMQEIPRHLVIATRVNANARERRTRRLLIRAWNQKERRSKSLPESAKVELVAAHLFGLLMNFGLIEQAWGLATAVERWGKRSSRRSFVSGSAERSIMRKESESVIATLAEPIVFLVEKLRGSNSYEDAIPVIEQGEARLTEWESSRRGDLASAFGVDIQILA